MAIKFMTNTVKVGPVKSFADLVREKMNKTAAAEEKVVKTAADDDDDEKEDDDDETEDKINVSVENDPEVEEEKTEAKAAKKECSADEAESSGQLDGEPNHQKGESEKPSDVTGENKKTEAKASPTYVKVAKLNPKTKTMLMSYWKNLYPAEYVDAMLTDQ